MKKIITSVLNVSILALSVGAMATTLVGCGSKNTLSDAEIRAFFDIEYLDDGTISLSNYTGNYTDIKIPKKYNGTKIAEIGEEAFCGCNSLTTVTFGEVLESIGNYAFSECPSLELFTVDEKNPNFCDENGVLFDKHKTELICYPSAKEGASYVVPESVETIGIGTFYGSSLESITLGPLVTTIGAEAFDGCTALTEIYCPNVTEIDEDAFYGCNSLKNVPTVK